MRRKVAAGWLVVVALGLAPAYASAAVVSGIQPALDGHPWIGTPGSPARSISSFSTSYDNVAETWTTSVAFYGAESAATAATLYVGLGTRQPGSESALIRASTDPAAPKTIYTLTGGSAPTPAIAPEPVTTFSVDRKTMTITVSDPALVGKVFDAATVRLSKGNVKYDILPAMTLTPNGVLGRDPRISLPFSDRTLRLSRGHVTLRLGTVTLPSSVAAFLEISGTPVAARDEQRNEKCR